MQVTIDLPDDIAKQILTGQQSIERSILEATALEGYRAGRLSQAQVRRMLGFATDMQTDAFLKEHGVFLEYDLEDLKRETEFSQSISRK